jgi:hypothetical protein
MYHAERIDQIVRFDRDESAQFLRVSLEETPLKPEHLKASTANQQALARNIDTCDLSAGPGEIYRIRADATPDLKDLFTFPASELCEPRDVRFYEVFLGLHLIEIFARPDLPI